MSRHMPCQPYGCLPGSFAPTLGSCSAFSNISIYRRYEDTFLCCISLPKSQHGHGVSILYQISTTLPQLMMHARMHPLL